MAWAQPTEYNDAVQNPQLTFSDPELRQSCVALNGLGLPLPRSGNFADVYQMTCPQTGQSWAAKCFTRQVDGLRQRYQAVSDHLHAARLPFMVDFRYLDEGIRIRGQWFPVLKMRWVEGIPLNDLVREHASHPELLDELAAMWLKVDQSLRRAHIAHGDLQHGNVLLIPGRKPGTLGLKLVDYDGMYVPALAQEPSGEIGHPAYQHPERLREGSYHAGLDRFSHLVICTALRCVRVAGKGLWERYDNGDNLLFREQDFEHPETSALFRELWTIEDPVAHALVGRLFLAALEPLEQVPLLEDVLRDSEARSLAKDEEERIQDLLRAGADHVRPVPGLVSPPTASVPWYRSPVIVERPVASAPPSPAAISEAVSAASPAPPPASGATPPPARAGIPRVSLPPLPVPPAGKRTQGVPSPPPPILGMIVAAGLVAALFGAAAGALGGTQLGWTAGALAGAGWIGVTGFVLTILEQLSVEKWAHDTWAGMAAFALRRGLELAILGACLGGLGGSAGGMGPGALNGGLAGLGIGTLLGAIVLGIDRLHDQGEIETGNGYRPIHEQVFRLVLIGIVAAGLGLGGVGLFKLGAGLLVPEVVFAPEELSPRDGAMLHDHKRDLDFRWKTTAHAAGYGLEIEYWDEDSQSWRPSGSYEGTNLGFSHRFEKGSRGRWRVWGIDAAGRQGPKSRGARGQEWLMFSFK
jgi:hypothetical protein